MISVIVIKKRDEKDIVKIEYEKNEKYYAKFNDFFTPDALYWKEKK